jgi:diphthine synthase
LEEVRNADTIFAEFYTSLMPGLSVERLEGLVGGRVRVVSRRVLEEEGGEKILRETREGRVVFLVPGDPLIATTHIDLRVRAEGKGIKTRVVHGASVVSAVVGLSGLQNYKFGRSVTVPFREGGFVSETPYGVVLENKKRGLHTLCYLDVRAEEGQYMSVKGGLTVFLEAERKRGEDVATRESLVVGAARAGSKDATVKAGYVRDMLEYEFGGPPHSLVFPGRLHFMEAEALIVLAGAPEEGARGLVE